MSQELLDEYIARESQMLQRTHQGKSIYCLDRPWLAYLSDPFIGMMVSAGISPNIFELGCGNGYGLRAILENYPSLERERIFGSSLTDLPGHYELRAMGLNIATGLLAEELPESWSDTFNIVMASVVMQWTDLYRSVPEIFRILAPEGLFMGYDKRMTVATIEHIAKENHTVTILPANPPEIQEHTGFVIQKNG